MPELADIDTAPAAELAPLPPLVLESLVTALADAVIHDFGNNPPTWMVDTRVAVVLVVVRRVEHQYGTATRLPAAGTSDRHQANERLVCGRRIHLIAVRQRVLQRLDERLLPVDALEVVRRRRPFALRLRAEEVVGAGD